MHSRLRLVAFATLVAACSRGPSDAQIDQELAAAQAENAALKTKAGKAEAASWTLTIRGNVKGNGITLDWNEIERRATTHVKTTSPTNTQDLDKVLDYRGIVIGDLLKELGAFEDNGPGGHDLTLVAADGFRDARPLALFQQNPILLAIEQDGMPLGRKTGGPLLEVFPYSSHPETRKATSEGGTYYVTTMIVGTEKLALDVVGKKLDARDLDGLSQKTVTGKVGFRSRWSASVISIHGPLLRDVIEVGAKTKLAAGTAVRIDRKPKSDIPARLSMTLPVADVLKCDIIVGTRSGDDHALIAAVQGGPAVLAFPKACAAATKNQAWPLYVEKISIVPGEASDDEADAGADGG